MKGNKCKEIKDMKKEMKIEWQEGKRGKENE